MRLGCSRSLVSLVEGGEGDRIAGRTLSKVADALGARLRIQVLWHGEDLDRLLDRRHSRLVEALIRWLESLGWIVYPEVTFQVGSERGAVDVLAFHPSTGSLLVVEVKSVVPDIQATLSSLDRKGRLALRIAAQRQLRAASVSRLLVLPEGTTHRRRIRAAAATFTAAYPARNVEVSRWMTRPAGTLSGILFLPDVNEGNVRRRVAARGSFLMHNPTAGIRQTPTSGHK
jgi:hypothetical protein